MSPTQATGFMALFKKRKGGDEPQATQRQPESIEAIRRRARHRLIGAGVLVLIAVVGFPVLFDTQPRPIAVDIPIEIPDRNKAKPLAAPAVVQAPAVSGPVTAPAVAAVAPDKPSVQAEPRPEFKPELKTESKAAIAAEPPPPIAATSETAMRKSG